MRVRLVLIIATTLLLAGCQGWLGSASVVITHELQRNSLSDISLEATGFPEQVEYELMQSSNFKWEETSEGVRGTAKNVALREFDNLLSENNRNEYFEKWRFDSNFQFPYWHHTITIKPSRDFQEAHQTASSIGYNLDAYYEIDPIGNIQKADGAIIGDKVRIDLTEYQEYRIESRDFILMHYLGVLTGQ